MTIEKFQQASHGFRVYHLSFVCILHNKVKKYNQQKCTSQKTRNEQLNYEYASSTSGHTQIPLFLLTPQTKLGVASIL